MKVRTAGVQPVQHIQLIEHVSWRFAPAYDQTGTNGNRHACQRIVSDNSVTQTSRRHAGSSGRQGRRRRRH